MKQNLGIWNIVSYKLFAVIFYVSTHYYNNITDKILNKQNMSILSKRSVCESFLAMGCSSHLYYWGTVNKLLNEFT